MKISKEAKVGIVVTSGILMFLIGFNFLKGKNLFSHTRKIYAVYMNIDGLVESSPVLVNGFRVGQIDDICLYSEKSEAILVTILINNKDIKIPRNSIAQIISSDLLGSKAVQLLLGDGNDYVQNGDTISSGIEDDLKKSVDKRIAPLQKKAEGLISSIDSVMIVVQGILSKDVKNNLSLSFEGIKNAISSFEQTSLRLDTLIVTEKHKLTNIFSKVESISSNLANNNDKLTNIINNFSSISDSLAKANLKSTIDNANVAMGQASSIMTKINKGQGSIGMLINNDTLYRNLKSASINLDKLFVDIKEHPQKYVHFSIMGGSKENK